MPDRSAILRPIIQAALDEGGVDAVVEVVCGIIAEFEARITQFETRIAELERRLNKNSSNSSKPPSSDGLKRPNRDNSLRPKNSGRKPGGQPGHPGQTLQASESPDITVNLPLTSCPKCGGDLGDQPVASEEKRQVFDLPDIKMLVTEYLAQRKTCPHCGALVSAGFPCGVTAPVQYGPGMQSAMTYLNVRQVIPCARVAEVCQDLFGHRPSAGSVVQSLVRCADLLAPRIEEIRDTLAQAPLLHADETGARCIGKTHWLHVVSTATHSLFSYSPKRGVEGFAVANVLPSYSGTLVHDFWGAYDKLGCDHSRCNAHLLRELKAFTEVGHRWAGEIISVLLEMKKAADEAREKNQDQIDAAHRQRFQIRYDKWVKAGLEAHPEITQPTGKRGRIKQSKETNLLRRLRDKREEVLRFMNDLSVPFDNNQAERDLRMIKVQQKVSGCFRSTKGAERFCVISSYISTIRKQGLNLIESIKAAFTMDQANSPT
jgi:transposase